MYHFVCNTQQKLYHFSNIIIHVLAYQHEVDVHLLFCFDLDLHLTCVPKQTLYHFDKMIMYVLQCPHDVDVSLLFCFYLDLHLTCSCFVHVHHLELRARDIPVTTGACY